MNVIQESNSPPTPRLGTPGLASLVEKLSALLAEAEACLGSDAPSLTSTTKRRTTKPPKGAGEIIRALAEVVTQVSLESDGLSASRMMERRASAEALQPLEARFGAISKRLANDNSTPMATLGG